MEKQIKKYKNYEDYLDSLMMEDDQKYLGDVETARQLVQLGYRSSGKTLTRQVQSVDVFINIAGAFAMTSSNSCISCSFFKKFNCWWVVG